MTKSRGYVTLTTTHIKQAIEEEKDTDYPRNGEVDAEIQHKAVEQTLQDDFRPDNIFYAVQLDGDDVPVPPNDAMQLHGDDVPIPPDVLNVAPHNNYPTNPNCPRKFLGGGGGGGGEGGAAAAAAAAGGKMSVKQRLSSMFGLGKRG